VEKEDLDNQRPGKNEEKYKKGLVLRIRKRADVIPQGKPQERDSPKRRNAQNKQRVSGRIKRTPVEAKNNICRKMDQKKTST